MMSRIVTNSENVGSILDTNSVTLKIANSHCIVCGTAFEPMRVGKLYCSARCKQFGFNHKDQIRDILSAKKHAIKPEKHVFFIEDYHEFIKLQKMIKRHTHLKQKQTRWENAEHEINMARQYGSDASSFTWSTFLTGSFTPDEDDELYTAEMELDEKLWGLKPRELSIEQWSFIKDLYPELDRTSFIEAVIGLSSDFYEQLSLNPTEKINQHSIIRNKYVNHCNMIADGNIQFKTKKEPI